LRRSANYGAGGKPSGAWAKVLRSYLLWEAAERGNVDAVRSVAAGFWGRTQSQFLEHTQDLSDALLVRAAKRLSDGVRAEAFGWLGELRTEDSSQTESVFDRFSRVADPRGQAYIDRALASTLTNPYPRYRDNALVALGVACIAVPDLAWARARCVNPDVQGASVKFHAASDSGAGRSSLRSVPSPPGTCLGVADFDSCFPVTGEIFARAADENADHASSPKSM
jgi:hypothetical protein